MVLVVALFTLQTDLYHKKPEIFLSSLLAVYNNTLFH